MISYNFLDDWKHSMTFFRKKASSLFLFFMLLQISQTVSAAPKHMDDGWENYVNSRYQYQICYPSRLLKPQGEPDSGDGQQFLATDGGKLTVFARNNVVGLGNDNGQSETSLSKTVEDEISYMEGSKGKTTYKVIKKNWAVFSGYNQMLKEFYGKIIKREDQLFIFEIQYPRSEREKYNKIVSVIEKCFEVL